MKKLRIFSFLAVALLLSVQDLYAAGSCVFNSDSDSDGGRLLEWVCTADGAGSVTSPTITEGTIKTALHATTPISGTIANAWITPGTAGDQPDALYDVELRSSTDTTLDFLGGMGDNLANNVTKMDTPLTETNKVSFQLSNQVFQPYAANCGAANKFTIKILVW